MSKMGYLGFAKICEQVLFWNLKLENRNICFVILDSVSFVKKASIRQH